jgi:hypothetical protein
MKREAKKLSIHWSVCARHAPRRCKAIESFLLLFSKKEAFLELAAS